MTGASGDMFEGHITIHFDRPCEVDGPYNIIADDNECFQQVYPTDLDVFWSAADFTLDPNIPIIAYDPDGVEANLLPSAPTDAFFALGKLNGSLLVGSGYFNEDERPFSLVCDGVEIPLAYLLSGSDIVTAEENAVDDVSSEEVRAHYEANLAGNPPERFVTEQNYSSLNSRLCSE